MHFSLKFGGSMIILLYISIEDMKKMLEKIKKDGKLSEYLEHNSLEIILHLHVISVSSKMYASKEKH